MIISLNWLRKFTPITLPIDELTKLIGSRLVEVESVTDLGKKYAGVVVAKVVSCEDHPDSDHLHICTLDDSGVVDGIERNDDGTVTVVCGAPNVRKGLCVAWLPPGSTVPESFGTDEPFVLGARKLRGVMSNGMIASMKELDLSDENEGILEIDIDANAGDKFADIYELNDYLIEVENKSLTHRPDCFGLIGFAREVAAISGTEFNAPNWYNDKYEILNHVAKNPVNLTVKIEDANLCERYEATVVSGADENAKSDILTQTYLSRSGMRPISAIVDIANELMLVSGQPLHTFDYDKLKKVSTTGDADIVVRGAKSGEKIELLDKTVVELAEGEIVICAGEHPIALAGAMGGLDTAIDASTKNILIESATFNLYKLRNTGMRHGIFSEALTRFTKGQPSGLTHPVLVKAAEDLVAKTGAEVVSNIIDEYPEKTQFATFEINKKINETLGTNYGFDEIISTLKNLGFEIDGEKAIAPWWRRDINVYEDIIEEVGRVNGFDEIIQTLPKINGVNRGGFDKFKNDLREVLSERLGANETLSYSFVHGDLVKKTNGNIENSFRITNAISPELQFYRQNLTASLLVNVNKNIRQNNAKFALYEFNKVHTKQAIGDDNLPTEFNSLALVYVDRDGKESAFYAAKKLLTNLLSNYNLKFKPTTNMDSAFEPKRSADIFLDEQQIGVVGEYKTKVCRELKLPDATAGFEIDIDDLYNSKNNKLKFKPIPKYPSTEKDITFQVEFNRPFEVIFDRINSALAAESVNSEVTPIDIYAPENKSFKNVTVRIKLTNLDSTITNNQANEIIDRVIASVGFTAI